MSQGRCESTAASNNPPSSDAKPWLCSESDSVLGSRTMQPGTHVVYATDSLRVKVRFMCGNTLVPSLGKPTQRQTCSPHDAPPNRIRADNRASLCSASNPCPSRSARPHLAHLPRRQSGDFAHRFHAVDWAVLESASPGFQPGARPSQLPVQQKSPMSL